MYGAMALRYTATVGNASPDGSFMAGYAGQFEKGGEYKQPSIKDPRGQPRHQYQNEGQWISGTSQQYFQCDFSWEMAVEADRIAWRLWKEEQAAQKGKGKGKGQPEVNATILQTFEV